MLSPQPGKSNKRNQVLGGVPITSIPDLRVVCYGQFPLTLGVVTVKEEKLTMPCDLDVYSAEEIPADALGQHAGEMLLEYEYSLFEEAVFGILCFRTKLIFTFLKLSDEHFHSILNHKDHCDICARSIIYYTRPYDYLIREQREAILELLFWLGLQTSSI
ncbi:uncharacterized protein LOC134275714 [Saccostrea cucullata]|uniref:uncharacterized protein LOC134275714 n=1 Tax=Saccostrea cuccullata TaxID=36930 RepID=UPI002ED40439